jgi:hypothetical protein
MMITANKIDTPYNHPFAKPSVAIPKIKDTIAAAHKIRNI